MKIKEIVSALDRFAPLPLQDGYDNAGLQIGLTDAEATGALLCLDVTEAVIDEAIALGYNLIVAHHPLLFKGYKSITGRDYIERCIIKALRHDIVIYASHTNLDNLSCGVSFKMAEKIGLTDVRVLDPKGESLTKLVTFVPESHAESVRNTLFEAGCLVGQVILRKILQELPEEVIERHEIDILRGILPIDILDMRNDRIRHLLKLLAVLP